MKVLHVIPWISLVRGGPSQVVIETVKALRRNNVNAEIATTNDNGLGLLDVPLQQRIEYQEVPVWFFSRFSPPVNSLREFTFSFQVTKWLGQNITNYDVLHIYSVFSYTSAIAMRIARLRGVPYIVRPLGQFCEWSLQQSKLKKQIYLNVIERDNLNHSQALHLTSEREKQELTQLKFKTNSFALPNGLIIPDRISNARQQLRVKLQLPEDEQIILFLSRLHYKKGLDYLIPALGKSSDRRFTFILAGSGDSAYELEVDRLLQQHRIYSRTIKTGFVHGEYKNLLLQGSDIFALTSYSENFGIAVLEALAAGTSVLTTPGVALSSLVEKEDLGYISQMDIDAIASNIEYILSHPQKAREKSDLASKFIKENYTWDKIAIDMIDIYQKTLNQQNQSLLKI